MRKIITILVALVLLGYGSLSDASHSHTLNQGQQSQDTLNTLTSGDAEGAQTAVTLLQNMRQGIFKLNISSFPDSTATLNVYIQTSADSGSTWTDIVSFAQVTGTGTQYAFWNSNALLDGTTTEVQTVTNESLSAGNVLQVPIGNQLRVSYASSGTTMPGAGSVESFLRE